MRILWRMIREADLPGSESIAGIELVHYQADRYGRQIPDLYAEAFG
jgi:hypothetical protein